ncbi:MAG: putrescine transport system substrate-binding protein [Gammaproteobacteria bacterium]|jgi:putrescine transport system substrate-binding protein|nr:putrescine transport system substrate-binding protein [Gammaproteobacteria bacterium]
MNTLFHRNLLRSMMLIISALSVHGCGRPDSAARDTRPGDKNDDEQVLNLYMWVDDMAPDTIASFEKLTGVKVHVSYFDTNETLEARMMSGNSGFDVVVPTGPFLQRQIRSGAYLPLDKTKLPNLVHLDPAIMARVALNDPGNAHGVVYTWGTYGIVYNRKMLGDALPHVPVDGWRLIFDPALASKLAACGINILDAPAGVTRLVLQYLGRNPNTPSRQDLDDVQKVLLRIRPFIRTIDSSVDTEALANGDICVSVSYNSTAFQARHRAEEAKNGIQIDFVIPQEGSLIWFDNLAIPRDAPNVANAHLFINYIMDPQVIAKISNYVGNANANSAASRFLDASIVTDATVYPPPDQQRRLFVQTEDPPDQSRLITRMWQKFKTGQ